MNLSSSFFSQQYPHAAGGALAMKNRAAYLEQQLRLGELATNPYLYNHVGGGAGSSSMPLLWLQQQQLRQEQLLFPSSVSLHKGTSSNASNFHKTMIPKKEEEDEDELLARFGVNGRKKAIPFPMKLLEVLSQKKYAHIIGWMPNGKSFVILRPKAFCNEVLPQHFKSAQYASFTRKLTRWGFTRCDDGTSEFYHPHFRRGRMDLAEKMTPSNMATTKNALKKQEQQGQNTDIKTLADEQAKSEDHNEEEEPTTEEDDPSSAVEAPEEAPETREGEEDNSSAAAAGTSTPRVSPTPNVTTSHQSTREEAVHDTPSSTAKKSSSSKKKRKRNSHMSPSSPSQFIKQAKTKLSTPLEMSMMDLPSSAVTSSSTAAQLQAIELEAMRLRRNIRAATLARQSFVGNNMPSMRMMPGNSSMMMLDAGGFSRFGGGGAMSMIPPSTNSSMMMMMGGGGHASCRNFMMTPEQAFSLGGPNEISRRNSEASTSAATGTSSSKTISSSDNPSAPSFQRQIAVLEARARRDLELSQRLKQLQDAAAIL